MFMNVYAFLSHVNQIMFASEISSFRVKENDFPEALGSDFLAMSWSETYLLVPLFQQVTWEYEHIAAWKSTMVHLVLVFGSYA